MAGIKKKVTVHGCLIREKSFAPQGVAMLVIARVQYKKVISRKRGSYGAKKHQ